MKGPNRVGIYAGINAGMLFGKLCSIAFCFALFLWIAAMYYLRGILVHTGRKENAGTA
jgi:hypothetical protein